MRKLILVGSVLIAGCATAPPPIIIKPMPAPPKCINIPGEGCKKISAGNVGGTTLGHSDDDEDIPINAIIKRKD